MKIRIISITWTALAVAAAGLLGGTVLNAAERAADAPAERVRPGGGEGFRGGLLDEKQRGLLREAMETHRKDLSELNEKMRAAQKELAKAVLGEKADEKVLREKIEAVSKIQQEETMLRAKILRDTIVPTLKPEQREQFENNPFALRMLLEGPAGGRAGGGGPPPQR